MGNCCYKRCCLLEPGYKCCFKYYKPIFLEIVYCIFKLISLCFLIYGAASFPWSFTIGDLNAFKNKKVKIIYIIGLITSIIRLIFFIIILLLRIFKLINGPINKFF